MGPRVGVPANLRAARTRAGLSQDEAARRLGVFPTLIEALESGERLVTEDDLAQVAVVYGVTVDDLVADA